MNYKILTINPGSTSTKIGLFEGENQVFEKTLRHSTEKLEQFSTIYEQYQFRKDVILKSLEEHNFDINTLNAVVGRGGLLRPLEGGTYKVNEKMLEDLKVGVQGQHASNLGGIIANEIAKTLEIPSYIVDPVVVDELNEVARISGISQIERKSKFHALNQKAVAKKYASETSKRYDDINVIVAHMGGGVTVGAHQRGRVIDVNNGIDGEGPFSPERSGEVPAADIVKMCYSQQYLENGIKSLIKGNGGFVGYLGTNDAREIETKIENGDKNAKLIYDAFCFQVSKEIGKCAVVLSGKVDAIILTGGIAYSKYVCDFIRERVLFIAPIVVYPGEDELLALAQGGLRVLRGEEEAKEY